MKSYKNNLLKIYWLISLGCLIYIGVEVKNNIDMDLEWTTDASVLTAIGKGINTYIENHHKMPGSFKDIGLSNELFYSKVWKEPFIWTDPAFCRRLEQNNFKIPPGCFPVLWQPRPWFDFSDSGKFRQMALFIGGLRGDLLEAPAIFDPALRLPVKKSSSENIQTHSVLLSNHRNK